MRESLREWKKNNPEKVKAINKRWYDKNKKRVMESNNEWRENNRDKVNTASRNRYRNDPTKVKEAQKRWRLNNKEKLVIQQRAQTYGVLVDDIIKLIKEAKCSCEICGTKLCDSRHKIPKLPREAHIDHDHKTGALRGLLCHSCNLGLGNFKDKVLYLELAAEYLRSHDGLH